VPTVAVVDDESLSPKREEEDKWTGLFICEFGFNSRLSCHKYLSDLTPRSESLLVGISIYLYPTVSSIYNSQVGYAK
jgi:hypothetical protein